MSSEREVLPDGRAVLPPSAPGHTRSIYVDRDVDVALRRAIEVAFIAAARQWGERLHQGLLRAQGFPHRDPILSSAWRCTGQGQECSAHNLPTPGYTVPTRRRRRPRGRRGDSGFPCVVRLIPRRQLSASRSPATRRELSPAILARASVSTTRSSSSGSSPGGESRSRCSGSRSVPRICRATVPRLPSKYTPGAAPSFHLGLATLPWSGAAVRPPRWLPGATRVDMMVSESARFVRGQHAAGAHTDEPLPKIADAAGISFGELCSCSRALARPAAGAVSDGVQRSSSATIAARRASTG